MSKRKTPEKVTLTGPKRKRQKITHNANENSNNSTNGETNTSSRMCNNNRKNTPSITAHCYDNITSQTPSIIRIKKHHVSISNCNNSDATLSNKQFEALCRKIDQRVKIYWPDDKQWYHGTIKDFKSSTNESLIIYDDDESEWLNLIESGREIVEFIHKNIDIGDKISSAKVLSTFNHGFIANINVKRKDKRSKNRKYTAIAFDNECIEHFLNTRSSSSSNGHKTNGLSSYESMDIYKLLHFCSFDADNVSRDNVSRDIPPWVAIGCNEDSDPITSRDSSSHIALMHKNKRNIKCNKKGMAHLKKDAIYPLSQIRTENYNNSRKIIVIGAGISGLACARELMNYGYSVTVLEARNRAGGRILTDYSLGLDSDHGVDVGGGWIHGIEGNPLTRLVSRLGLTLHATSGRISMYDSDGNEVDARLDSAVEKEFNQLLDKISRDNAQRFKRIHKNVEYDDTSGTNDDANDTSLGDVLHKHIAYKSGNPKECDLWKWHFSNLEYSNATDLKNLSLTHWDQDDEYAFNGDHCLIQEGYGRIIDGLAHAIDIRYCNIVDSIDYGSDQVRVIASANGDRYDVSHSMNDEIRMNRIESHASELECGDRRCEYVCDAAVVSLPLGVLKSDSVSFTPPLPLWKRSAIDAIGYGLLNKVFLRFSDSCVFWNIVHDYVGFASSVAGEFYLFVNLVPVCGTPVLMSLMSGSFAEKLEQETDQYIVDYAMKILRNIFGADIQDPIDFYVTKWGRDRFSRGSYSYIAPQSNGDDYDKLSYSICDQLYFCGEATIRKWPASVHGAYLSGIREARNIINCHYPIHTIFNAMAADNDNIISNHDKNETDIDMHCGLCGGDDDDDKLIGPFQNNVYIHEKCAKYTPDIHMKNKVWYNVMKCIERSKSICCCYCAKYGASIHCHNQHCLTSYHPQCANIDFNAPDQAQFFFCIKHRDDMLALHVKQKQNRKRNKNKLRLPRNPKTPY